MKYIGRGRVNILGNKFIENQNEKSCVNNLECSSILFDLFKFETSNLVGSDKE